MARAAGLPGCRMPCLHLRKRVQGQQAPPQRLGHAHADVERGTFSRYAGARHPALLSRLDAGNPSPSGASEHEPADLRWAAIAVWMLSGDALADVQKRPAASEEPAIEAP